ncbi:TnsD family transposase [Endozoicomonas gorgoniicola]|uniref:TnsD family transposase n=1 Tax=Endozoicomonas gorgoniicola TaxID=1234144 RepID=A0ABT3N425_9GAMM|nr:TnsD family Tn7-like transposition protein [Endozoicomonas gorgoniicola]MCW7556371.1 TnsD family transposase [Endozoicomonas gorgoniicola]
MIIKFPEPFPDETFYSWIARYHDHSANGLYKFTAYRLYGESPSCAIYGLPSGLKPFCENLRPLIIYCPEEIIDSHTILPYFSSAVIKQRIDKARTKMLQPSNTGIHGQLGSLTSLVKNFRYLRYCPVCLDDDEKHMGEPYWHRSHQLPGVLVCPFHGVPTLNATVDKQSHKHLHYASARQHARAHLRQKKIQPDNKLLSIARASSDLLKGYKTLMSGRAYREELLKKGFNQGRFINQDKLYRHFLAYWSPQLLKDVGAYPDPDKYHWLRRIGRHTENASQLHPLYHVLMTEFLDHLEQATAIVNIKPELKESYPCPNPFCNDPAPCSARLDRTHRRQKNGPLHGTITCTCGYSYSCNLEAEKHYKEHVISYGSVWKNKFIGYIQAGYTIPQMIEAMSVSRGVILRKVTEFKLNPDWQVKMPTRLESDQRIKDRIKTERKHFREYRKRYPRQSRSQIKEGMRAGYKFLDRQDKEWLLKHLPSVKQPRPRKELLNWKKRDRDYLQQVKSIVKELLSQPGKPIRITPNTISKIMGRRNLFSKVSFTKIPRTAAFLEEACNPEPYFQRRFQWAKEQLIKNGQTITRSNLIYAACLGYNLSASQESMIQELLEANHETPYTLPENKTP